MKAALIGLAALAAIALVIGGYVVFRPDSRDEPATYAAQLEALCTDSRKQIEALGQPSEVPITKLFPGTVRLGRSFLEDARALRPPPEQAAAAMTFLHQSGLYYDGLEYAYQFLTLQKNQVAFARIVDGAIANRTRAETAAKSLRASACALQPFDHG